MSTVIKKYKNGLTLAVTNMQGFDSVAFNIFVKTGSVNEVEGNYGISHFIEHMLFKGTKKRNAYEIAKQLESLGANVNAYTDREETTYFFKSTLENLEPCVEILSDMFFNSVFDSKEMAREKKVVCEEISMYNDDAYSKSELLVNSVFYAGTKYANDVAGSKQSVKSITRKKILDYMQNFYTPQNTIISFSGNITLEKAEKLFEQYFLSQYHLTLKDEVELLSKINAKNQKPIIKHQTIKKFKDNEQSHICISYKSCSQYDKIKYPLVIMNNALGRGMSSKLFQRIREQLGLVYSISSSVYCNVAGGDLTIHFATTTKNVPLALKSIKAEIDLLIKNGLTETEFLDAKNNYISSVKLAWESTSSMNTKICQNIKNHGKEITKQDILDMIDEVTLTDVNNAIKYVFDNNDYCISYVGQNTKLNLLKKYNS